MSPSSSAPPLPPLALSAPDYYFLLAAAFFLNGLKPKF